MQYLRQGNILDMAEAQIISNTNLPITPNSSANALLSDTVGQKQSVSGNFNAHLNGSLREISNVDSGEELPLDGKSLPQIISTQTLNDPKSRLLSSTQEFQFNTDNSNVLAENQVGLQPETLKESIDAKLLDIQRQFDIPIESDEILPIFSKLSRLSNVSDTIEEKIILGPHAPNNIANQVIDELSAIPTVLTQTNTSSITNPIKVDNVSSPVSNQNLLINPSLPIDIEIQQSLLSSTANEDKEIVNYSAIQNFNRNENTSEKLNDFITKYLSEDNASKTIIKDHKVNADIFQQTSNALKTDLASQHVNISSSADSYVSLNTGSILNKSIEAPIPLLIKQGVNSEQVQQTVDESISQNVKWLIGNKAQNARINVFPESLGQVNIALNIEDSNLKLNFIASSHVTKELIEASMSTLRSHFNENGINLQEVNVETRFSDQAGQESQFADFHDESETNLHNGSNFTENDTRELLPHGSIAFSTPVCLLDAYA